MQGYIFLFLVIENPGLNPSPESGKAYPHFQFQSISSFENFAIFLGRTGEAVPLVEHERAGRRLFGPGVRGLVRPLEPTAGRSAQEQIPR